MDAGRVPIATGQSSCAKCNRAGQYRKAALLERYGADIAMPLRHELAECPRRNQQRMVIFPDRSISMGSGEEPAKTKGRSSVLTLLRP